MNLDATGNLFLGTYMRYTDGASLFAGTFVLERIDQFRTDDFSPTLFDYFSTAAEQPILAIQKYLYDKSLNKLKLPTGVFTETDLNRWSREKSGTQINPMPDIDLFISAPVKGFDKIVDAQSFDFEKAMSPTSLDTLRMSIKELIQSFKESSEGFQNIWYSLEEDKAFESQSFNSRYLREIELDAFHRSKRILITLPFPSVTSSLMEIGWTMVTKNRKPMSVCYSGREDLPYLLQKADTLKNHRIYLTSLRKIGDIAGISDWIINSKFREL